MRWAQTPNPRPQTPPLHTYTRAIVPTPGDLVTSRVINSAAAAMNDRLKVGPAVPWRVLFHAFSAFRSIRNPDASRNLFPSQAEFFEFYQQLDPLDGEWPVGLPGDPEAANLANQMAAFVHGSDVAEVDDEATRLTEEDAGGISMDTGDGTARALWQLAKRQRGAIDPRTGGTGSPAATAATSHAWLRQDPRSSAGGFAFGDYIPGPEFHGSCSSPDTDYLSYDLIFTPLAGGAPLTYNTCPSVSGSAIGTVHLPDRYVVFLWSGAQVVLLKTLWFEGPYTSNPALRKTANGYIEHALAAFASEFRGTAEQRADGLWNGHAFDFQAFLTSQYHLAPQRGTETSGYVSPRYPKWKLVPGIGRVGAGTRLQLIIGGIGTGYRVAAGFVCASAFVSAKGLVAAARVAIYRDGIELATVELDPEAEDTTGIIATWDRPEAGGTITATLLDTTAFSGAARELAVEITELQAYKPSLLDLYLVLRCGGVDFGTPDGTGEQSEQSAEIVERYAAYGCITSAQGHIALPGSLGPLNTNAVFDAARRMSRCVRIMPRQNFRGVAQIDGKPVVWFNRWARGLRHGTPIDLFSGIAPSSEPIASGKLVWGREYVVRGTAGQAIFHAGRGYGVGAKFKAAQDVATYAGSGQVFEADGIHAALPNGWSNRWLSMAKLAPYRDYPSSIWKPSAFTDYWSLLNRCLFGDPAVADNPELLQHVAYGQRITSPLAVLFPEAPETFNYTPTPGSPYGRANRALCDDPGTYAACAAERKAFYQSCRLIEPWPEVESVELDGDEVKVTYKARVDPREAAQIDFARDTTGWDVTALRTETRRTWINGLREYQLWSERGINATVKTGDQAFNSALQTTSAPPYGAVFPTFLWVQLIPEAYEDGNSSQDLADSPLVHDISARLVLYLRGACEGFVDGRTSAANACAYGSTDLYGYTWENLAYEATGGRGFPVLPSVATDYIDAADCRPDQPDFRGPMPNIIVAAETAAAIARALNLLTEFRVMLPATLQMRTLTGSRTDTVTVLNGRNLDATIDGAMAQSGSGSSFAVWFNGAFPTPSPTTASAWADSASETVGAGATLGWTGAAGELITSSARIEWRWVGDEDATETLPMELKDALVEQPVIYGRVVREVSVAKRSRVGQFDGRQCHPPGNPADAAWGDGTGSSSAYQSTSVLSTDQCLVLRSGGASTDQLPTGIAAVVDAVSSTDVCVDGPSAALSITVAATTTPAITIPLVDLPT